MVIWYKEIKWMPGSYGEKNKEYISKENSEYL